MSGSLYVVYESREREGPGAEMMSRGHTVTSGFRFVLSSSLRRSVGNYLISSNNNIISSSSNLPELDSYSGWWVGSTNLSGIYAFRSKPLLPSTQPTRKLLTEGSIALIDWGVHPSRVMANYPKLYEV